MACLTILLTAWDGSIICWWGCSLIGYVILTRPVRFYMHFDDDVAIVNASILSVHEKRDEKSLRPTCLTFDVICSGPMLISGCERRIVCAKVVKN